MISVIVPYMNAAKWIRRCTESLKAQKGDFEFIMVDDFSTDNSSEIVKKHADDRFILTDNYHHVGVSGARNCGLDMARGDWITFLDADDELLPVASEVFDRMIRMDPTANIIQSNHLRQYLSAGVINKYPNKHGTYTLQNLPQQWCMVWNKLYRHELIKGLEFDTDLQFGEDELFNMECLARDGRIFHTMTNTVTMIRHFDNRKSLSHIKNRNDILKEARAIEDFIIRQKDPDVRDMAYKRLLWHWSSGTYKKAFGVL